MSGPVTTEDVPATPAVTPGLVEREVELEPGRVTTVGALPVRRVLPRRVRRTVGSWCFADHAGPVQVRDDQPVDIGPHPHMGLQTVTWLLAGELLHRDSLGSEQLIRPGQLNLMTSGRGVAHSEENPGQFRGEFHAVQLWVAQPESTRNGSAAFEHHAELPALELPGARATVFVGDFGGEVSPARRDTEHVGVELVLHGPGAVVPLRGDYEYALVVLEGTVTIGERVAEPGLLAYLGEGRDEVRLQVAAPARALLLGGVPFPEAVLMWWNFVARSREEVSEARRQWSADDGRFGTVRSSLARIEVDPPPWE
jgi:redox-sensitive bicupin YhaK (pirin superfamily)